MVRVVADRVDVVEVVLVIPLDVEFGAIDGAGDDGVQCGWVGPEVVLDDGLSAWWLCSEHSWSPHQR